MLCKFIQEQLIYSYVMPEKGNPDETILWMIFFFLLLHQMLVFWHVLIELVETIGNCWREFLET